MANRIQLRRGTAAEWATDNPILADGEPGVERDTGKQKFGNGVSVWTALPYASKGDQGIPGVADDTSVEALIADPDSDTRGALNATFVPKWKATTAYLAGEKVLNPSGDVVSAKVDFTSGASYSAANWDLSATVAGKLDKADAVPKWKPTTAYAAGEAVVSPAGDVVTAKIAFTSGASYSAANWNLSPSYTGAAKTTTDGTEAQAQLGPKVRTKGAGANSVMVLQNNDPASGDNATRIYIVPKASVTSGVGGALKIFGDDYSTDQTNYRDFGLYFSQNQNGETGTRGDGCFYLNIKTNGTKAGLLPDLVFSMQDGTGIVGRACSPIVGGQSKYTMVIGPGKPEHAAKRALVLEVQGDMGFDGAADHAIYWETTGGTSSNMLAFERTASNGNLRIKLGGAQKATFTGDGGLVLGDNAADMSVASTVGFLHIRSMAGTPTGTPALFAGASPFVWDNVGNKLWVYSGGSWKSAVFA